MPLLISISRSNRKRSRPFINTRLLWNSRSIFHVKQPWPGGWSWIETLISLSISSIVLYGVVSSFARPQPARCAEVAFHVEALLAQAQILALAREHPIFIAVDPDQAHTLVIFEEQAGQRVIVDQYTCPRAACSFEWHHFHASKPFYFTKDNRPLSNGQITIRMPPDPSCALSINRMGTIRHFSIEEGGL